MHPLQVMCRPTNTFPTVNHLAAIEEILQLPQRSCKLEWSYKQVILPGSLVSKGMTVSRPLTDEVHIFGDLMAARKKMIAHILD